MEGGIAAVTPVGQGAAPPPAAAPMDSTDIGSVGGNEKSLIQEALAEMEGGEGGGEQQPEVAPEAKKPEPKAEELTQKKLSDGFAKLAAKEERHERRVAEQTAKLQAERTAFEAERAENAKLTEARERAKTSPLEALALLGWDYKQVVDYVMNDGKIPQEVFAKRLQDEHKSNYEKMQAELEEIKSAREREKQEYEAQQDTSRIEHQTRQLFADGAEGLQKFPNVAHHFRRSPEMAQKLLTDIQQLRSRHFNETCVRDEKGRIIRKGEIVDALPAVAYIERILADMQVSTGNPGQPGAVTQTANAGAERQQAPKPLTARDSSVTSMPSDEELQKMSQEELDALSLRMYNGG